MYRIMTSESVSEGHPDKVSDQISDAVLDACLSVDPASRVACETMVTTNRVIVSGEITTNATIDFDAIARKTITEIGYTEPGIGFSADECEVQVYVGQQSSDIAQGVDDDAESGKAQGAGDQGMMFGYASDETPELMPAPVHYSHQILVKLAELRKGDPSTYGFLRPDSKSQVTLKYDDNGPVALDTIVVSHQHTPEASQEQIAAVVKDVVAEVIPERLRNNDVRYFVNPTGKFEIGGPTGDCGLTGRKIIVDTYGGLGHHGGGAFSGKDPSKVDRSAAYVGRYVARSVVAAGLARRCEVQLSYAIGVAHPISVFVDTFGTGTVDDRKLDQILLSGEVFDLSPAGIVTSMDLLDPYNNGWAYRETAAYGHFGRSQFPWEKTDRVEALRAACS
jgi:S-adenosylmethionine synthetase